MKGVVTMNAKEVDRIAVLDRLMKKEIKQTHAAKLLQLSTRQVRNLAKRYKREGVKGITHKLRGLTGNRLTPESIINQAVDTVCRSYADFGPTLAHEKLTEIHGVTFSRETLRRAMIEHGLWKARQRKIVTLHQLRERRDCLGELVQLDGSPHDWFEGRGPCCTLLVFIDDATGKVPWAQFVESETTAAYFAATQEYLLRFGKPLAFYVDRHGVFRVNTTRGGTAETTDSNGITQFGRAMRELGIELIFANTPQAKGRVERVNQTLQDRLVKEMRLAGVSTREEANAFLPGFLEDFNRKFAVVPKSPVNIHRPLTHSEKLDDILCQKHTRILSKQLTLSYGSKIYQIQTNRPTYAMRHAPVVVREDTEGRVTITYKEQQLAYTIVTRQPKAEIVDSKQLNLAVDCIAKATGIAITVAKTPWIPSEDHPWRQYRI